MAAPKLGRVQTRIMEVLWEAGHATAREITDALNRTGTIAHSTVQTLLRKLEAKGAVAHDVDDRTFVFRPLVQPGPVRQTATREFVDRLFGGSTGGLVAYLLRQERISPEEMREIRALIEARSSRKSKKGK